MISNGLVYYTDNSCDPFILEMCRKHLLKCVVGFDIVSVSQQPLNFGRNFVLSGLKREPLSIFKQIYKGLEESTADIIYLIEHDILYHSSHFDFTPPKDKYFYYNRNRYAVDPDNGKAVFYQTNVLSLLVAYKPLLLKHFKRRVELTERDGFKSSLGYSPPKGIPKSENPGHYKTYMSEFPSLDIRHQKSYTRKRMTKDQFRNERGCRDWKETYDLPYWGVIGTDFKKFLERVV